MGNGTAGKLNGLRKRSRFAWFQRLGGYALAAAGLIWVLHDVQPHELLARLTLKDWRWAAAAVATDILALLTQGWRWSLLVSSIGRLRRIRATQAIYAGLFTNEILPLHVGELVRAYLVARWLDVRFATVVPSIVVERLLDGVWLALGVGAVAFLVPLPRNVESGADIFGAVVLAGVLVFAYLVYWRREHEHVEGSRLRFLTPIAASFRQVAVTRQLWRASVLSLLMVILQALSFWMVMPAYGLKLAPWSGLVVFLIVHIGTAIPNAPGNVGTYQFFTALGLTLLGVDKPVAAAFSFVVFVVLTAPAWIIGFLAFSRAGLTFGQIRREIRSRVR